ncbi:hypothetical protein D3C72_1795740 [compost metagenome]
MGVGRLRDKHRRHGQVNRCAVQVKRVAGRNNQAHHRFLTTQLLHFVEHARQHRLGRRGPEHDQQFFFYIANEFENAEAVGTGNGAQHHHHEQNAGDIEAGNQLAKLQQRAHAIFTDGECHRPEGPQRRQTHNHVDDAENHAGETVDHVED